MLPDFRVRQRDYLLEIARALTQELDLDKLLTRILRISIEMLAGQAGIIALKETSGWRVVAAHGIPAAFLSYLEPLLAEEKAAELNLIELNRMLKDLTYTASMGLLNGVGIPLATHGQVIGVIFIFRSYPDLIFRQRQATSAILRRPGRHCGLQCPPLRAGQLRKTASGCPA